MLMHTLPQLSQVNCLCLSAPSGSSIGLPLRGVMFHLGMGLTIFFRNFAGQQQLPFSSQCGFGYTLPIHHGKYQFFFSAPLMHSLKRILCFASHPFTYLQLSIKQLFGYSSVFHPDNITCPTAADVQVSRTQYYNNSSSRALQHHSSYPTGSSQLECDTRSQLWGIQRGSNSSVVMDLRDHLANHYTTILGMTLNCIG